MHTRQLRLADDLVQAHRRDLISAADHHRLIKLAAPDSRARRSPFAAVRQNVGSVLIRIGEQMQMGGARGAVPLSDSPASTHGTPIS